MLTENSPWKENVEKMLRTVFFFFFFFDMEMENRKDLNFTDRRLIAVYHF